MKDSSDEICLAGILVWCKDPHAEQINWLPMARLTKPWKISIRKPPKGISDAEDEHSLTNEVFIDRLAIENAQVCLPSSVADKFIAHMMPILHNVQLYV